MPCFTQPVISCFALAVISTKLACGWVLYYAVDGRRMLAVRRTSSLAGPCPAPVLDVAGRIGDGKTEARKSATLRYYILHTIYGGSTSSCCCTTGQRLMGEPKVSFPRILVWRGANTEQESMRRPLVHVLLNKLHVQQIV